MITTELSSVPDTDLPLAQLRDHLRLSQGFVDDTDQDTILAHYLRAALAQIETEISQVVLQRRFVVTAELVPNEEAITLPLAPFHAVDSVEISYADGAFEELNAACYRVERGGRFARVVLDYPVKPSQAIIRGRAGISARWTELPSDLAHALLLLATRLYEGRSGEEGLGPALAQVLHPYKPIRLMGED